ncbi:restriction endonuclease subunit S [Paenibacillus thiaminolyticus]|uniref:restriction endonuclease subunit S n=1 Tax=Paenibacillus thiaminolyticus TaxID=49283 RepID=UPI002542E3C8|nr:restriction endonuclease subunit S [Paenibacillus thiaminolyticus]WII36241.1 restriction endonuclease subunit S [Paenibacillus thiaminolyticus]
MKQVREGYKMTELGEIPVEWEVKSIDDIFNVMGGVPLPRSKTGSGDIYYLHYGDIHKLPNSKVDIELDKSWLPLIDGKSNELRQEAFLEDGDVVFADASEDYLDIGKNVVVCNNTSHEFIAGLHTIIAREKKDRLVSGYKRFCFKTEKVRKQLAMLATGSTVLGISKANIVKVKFLVPSLPEQQKIAEILSAVDAQIEITEQLIEKTKELKKGLMQQLLTKGIGHTEFKQSELGEIPVDWEIYRFGELLSFVGSGVTPRGGREVYQEYGVIFIRSQNVYSEGLKLDDVAYISEDINKKMRRTSVFSNDVLLNITGASIGRCAVVPKKFPPANVNQHVCILRVKNEISSKYLQSFVISNYGQNQIFKQQLGQTREGLNFEQVRNMIIPLPPIEEQQKIAAILSSVDDQIESYEQEKEKYLQLKKGLMQQLLTGKMRVTV